MRQCFILHLFVNFFSQNSFTAVISSHCDVMSASIDRIKGISNCTKSSWRMKLCFVLFFSMALSWVACISSPHSPVLLTGSLAATCDSFARYLSPAAPGQREHFTQNHRSHCSCSLGWGGTECTFRIICFPSYVTDLSDAQKKPKEGSVGIGISFNRRAGLQSSQGYSNLRESFRKTASNRKSLSRVGKQNLPRHHFLRLPLLMRNSQSRECSV